MKVYLNVLIQTCRMFAEPGFNFPCSINIAETVIDLYHQHR